MANRDLFDSSFCESSDIYTEEKYFSNYNSSFFTWWRNAAVVNKWNLLVWLFGLKLYV